MPEKTISFTGTSVSLEYGNNRSGPILEFLCRHMPVSSERKKPRNPTYSIKTGLKGNFFLYKEQNLIYRGKEEGIFAEVLLSRICHDLADKSRGGLLFHAAALIRKNEGILFPGKIGAGKTTLALWLALRGYFYLTDELALIGKGENVMHALKRPLNLKKPSR
ncbi:MAG: hypothetical protein JXB26_17790 [Candidatus Aminicenantes bacterium]|nr:hypothetical protein [Candidatus Aminicenantes bacterium]